MRDYRPIGENPDPGREFVPIGDPPNDPPPFGDPVPTEDPPLPHVPDDNPAHDGGAALDD